MTGYPTTAEGTPRRFCFCFRFYKTKQYPDEWYSFVLLGSGGESKRPGKLKIGDESCARIYKKIQHLSVHVSNSLVC